MDLLKVRYVEVKGITYVRAEDVATMLRDLGAAEETDVRDRLEETARTVDRVFVR